jgi:hypothetical protein
MVVTALALVAEGMLALVQRAVTPRGIRLAREPTLARQPAAEQISGGAV